LSKRCDAMWAGCIVKMNTYKSGINDWMKLIEKWQLIGIKKWTTSKAKKKLKIFNREN
jgi:hypothetical protein